MKKEDPTLDADIDPDMMSKGASFHEWWSHDAFPEYIGNGETQDESKDDQVQTPRRKNVKKKRTTTSAKKKSTNVATKKRKRSNRLSQKRVNNRLQPKPAKRQRRYTKKDNDIEVESEEY